MYNYESEMYERKIRNGFISVARFIVAWSNVSTGPLQTKKIAE